MKRFAFFLPLAAVLVLSASPARADAMLRPSVVIDSDVVKLGDLFDGLSPDKADKPVARAPMPGHRSVVDADWLQRVAVSNDVDWRPANVFVQIVVERSGVTVSRDQIAAQILNALSDQNLPPDSEVEFSRGVGQIVVPAGSQPQVNVHDLSYDARNKRFSANVEVPTETHGIMRMRVAGQIYSTISVPVLARAIGRGDIIKTSDLVWQRVREDGLRRDTIIDVDQIIGMAPRMNLRSGQMVYSNDVQKPLAVKRGSLVTMILKSGSMSLTAQGRAIESGSVGDVVRVANAHSNLVIQGTIEGPNLIVVTPNGSIALAN